MSITKTIEKLRTEYGAGNTDRRGNELLSEKEALIMALKTYEQRIVELELATVDSCRIAVELQAVQALLAAEQKKSRELQIALSAYQCGTGGAGLFDRGSAFGGTGAAGTSAKKEERKEKAAAELADMMGQFDFSDDEEFDTGEETGEGSGEPKEGSKKLQETEKRMTKLRENLQSMKAVLGTLHEEKISAEEGYGAAIEELQKAQVQFTNCRQQLTTERQDRRSDQERFKRESSEHKARLEEEEHQRKVQVGRIEERATKEITALQRKNESLAREVERMRHYEERHKEMEEEVASAMADKKSAVEQARELKDDAEMKYASLKFAVRRRFAEISDTIISSLPATTSANLSKVPLPQLESLGGKKKIISMKQLGEADLVTEANNVASMVSYLTALLQPVVKNNEALQSRLERVAEQKAQQQEMKEKYNVLLFSLGEQLASPVVSSDVRDTLEGVERRDGEFAAEHEEVESDAIRRATEKCRHPEDYDEEEEEYEEEEHGEDEEWDIDTRQWRKRGESCTAPPPSATPDIPEDRLPDIRRPSTPTIPMQKPAAPTSSAQVFLPLAGRRSTAVTPPPPASDRAQQQARALSVMSQVMVHQDEEYDHWDSEFNAQRAENLSSGVEVLKATRKVLLKHGKVAKQKKKKDGRISGGGGVLTDKMLQMLLLDPNSRIGQPVQLQPSSPSNRAGGGSKGKLASGPPNARERTGPPERAPTPHLQLGTGSPKPPFPL